MKIRPVREGLVDLSPNVQPEISQIGSTLSASWSTRTSIGVIREGEAAGLAASSPEGEIDDRPNRPRLPPERPFA